MLRLLKFKSSLCHRVSKGSFLPLTVSILLFKWIINTYINAEARLCLNAIYENV